MSKLIFTEDRTENSIGFIGGTPDEMPKEMYPKIPNTELYQTHLCTLFPSFFKNGSLDENKNISIFISIEKHSLGGVKESVSSNYTINQKNDLSKLSNKYSQVLIYDIKKDTAKVPDITINKKYFEIVLNEENHLNNEHLFFEEHGMGLDVSKFKNIPYFEQDIIRPSPKYSFYLQLLEEDIEDDLHIFQNGIGYFYLDKNIKKLRSGDEAGIFFIQNT